MLVYIIMDLDEPLIVATSEKKLYKNYLSI